MAPMVPSRDESIENEEVGMLAVRLTNIVVLPMVLRSAIRLNIIDIIMSSTTSTLVNDDNDNGFFSSTEIAARLPTSHPNTPVVLDKMICLLASYDILKCSLITRDDGEVERVYGPGSICKFLVSNKNANGPTLSSLFLLHNHEVLLKSWDSLDETIVRGGVPFDMSHGMNIFNYMEINESFKKVFQEGMSCHSTLLMNKILDQYKGFEQVKVLVDVGGGIGSSLQTIISKYPHIKGINYDLPSVLTNAPFYSGVEHIGGDFFETIPRGDTILLKWILHNWNDEDCLKILKNCWKSLDDNGKVVIMEMMLPQKPESDVSSKIGFEYNMLMFAHSPSGKERTQKEFKALASNSGFKDCEFKYSQLNSYIVEFHK